MASKVKETTFGARDTLRITSSMDIVGLKDVEDGTEIEYCGHVVQEIVNENTGEVFESTLVKAADGKIYATRSESFKKTLDEILACIAQFGESEREEPIILTIRKAKSKNGNTFVTCSLA